MQKYNIEDYTILVQKDEDFEIREKSISFEPMVLTCEKGIDNGLILNVIKINHSVQFCKNMNFHNGYEIYVKVAKSPNKDYMAGEQFPIMIPSHIEIVEHLSKRYKIN